MNNELLYQIALTLVPQIGDVHAKSLLSAFHNAADIFKAPRRQLEKIEGIGTIRAKCIKDFTDFKTCEKEISFIERYQIQPLFIQSPEYPRRLLNCYDSPILLYYRGNANLNTQKIISVVGTRSNSDYGKWACEQIIEGLKDHSVLIVSGLAFGIDSIAHRSALKNNAETVAVLAHGLDRIYPVQNKTLAKQMTVQGGLLTDFRSGNLPDKQNFPRRNRITAGICDALVVIESGKKGGSLITAEIANSYNKDVFAFPGRANDPRSEGCHYLIKNNKASLITTADDILENLNWKSGVNKKIIQQRELFINLTPGEKIIFDLLQTKDQMPIDELYFKSGLSSSIVASALLSLELNGIVRSLPGKMYLLV